MRLHGFDYRSAAYYFVTICTYQKQWLFEDETLKNPVEIVIQKIESNVWPEFDHVEIDSMVIMPNHIHFIFAFIDPENATDDFEIKAIRLSKSLGSLVATFKGEVTKMVRRSTRDFELRVWQRGYYDRIIRDENEHNRTRKYIRLNPEKWEDDSGYVLENLDRMIEKMTYHDNKSGIG